MTIKQVTVWMCDYCGGLYHVKGMAEDCHPSSGAEGVCKKCAEEVCGCSTMNAEEPAVQEPDWIPDGDGRAIGQQNFGINLSPLHAEGNYSAWKTLGDVTMKDGVGFPKIIDFNRSKKEQEAFIRVAEKIVKSKDLNCTHCNPQGDRKVRHSVFILMATKPTSMKIKGDRTLKFKKGDIITLGKGCMNALYEDKSADTTGSPSPTFNENITGQDGPSADPTNQTFEAMRTMAPSTRDVDSARRSLKNSGYGDVIYDRYIVNQQGSSNKFYYTAITEKDGKYFPMGAYGRIGYLGTLFNVAGKKERPFASFGSMELAYRQIKEKEDSKINARKSEKRYVDYTLTRGAESLSEIEGPTAEATSGGLHSPSSFDITWEDGSGQSSASLPPNEIAWAEGKSTTWLPWAIGIAVAGMGGLLLSMKGKEQKAENNLKSVVKARKGCCGGSKIVRKDSEFSVGQINPVAVEDQNDVYGAEELHSPQTSAKVSQPNWGPQTTYLQNQRSTQKMW